MLNPRCLRAWRLPHLLYLAAHLTTGTSDKVTNCSQVSEPPHRRAVPHMASPPSWVLMEALRSPTAPLRSQEVGAEGKVRLPGAQAAEREGRSRRSRKPVSQRSLEPSAFPRKGPLTMPCFLGKASTSSGVTS